MGSGGGGGRRAARASAGHPLGRRNINKPRSPASPAAARASSIHPRAGGAKQTGLPSPARTEAHCSLAAALTSVCERAPGAGRLARGAERGGDPGRPGPRPGVRAGGSAADRGALLLGRSRRLLQPSSQRRATPGVRSTFSRSCPLAREVLGAHAHTPPDRALAWKK